jgi:hypothetical protein
LHIELLRMPFASYLTTNFDPCLEVAAEHVGKCPAVQVWPAFTISRLGSGDIFYLHAKVPRRGQICPMERLRLTASDYREAYDEGKDIAELITLAMNEENILLFIGYGLREPAIREVLKSALIQKKVRATRMERYEVTFDAKRPHFALVPEGEIASEEVAALLNECNVQIIEFPKQGNFAELKRMLTDLFYRTLEIKAPLIRGIGELLPTDKPGLSG